MERWQNKIAVVTGASSGIGAATCKALVEKGMIVVGLARRVDKMESQVRPSIAADKQQNFHCYKCDVSEEQSVKAAFSWIEQTFGGVDVLVNNAGIYKQTTLLAENNTEDITNTLNTNVLAVVWCTREAFKNMKKRQVDGHVVIMNSLTGHCIPNIADLPLNIYPPSKHALTAMTEILRQEFLANNTKIKVTSISPGAVKTHIVDFPPELPVLKSEDIADAVVYCIQTPPHVQIHEMIIKPVGEVFFCDPNEHINFSKMQRWQNKIAVVTGAGSGIGAATCKLLVEKGMIVVGLDIRLDKMETQVKSSLNTAQQHNFHCLKCDVRDEANVKETFALIEKQFGGVDVFVNNAGIIRQKPLLSSNNSEDIRNTIDTNVLAVVWCTREAFQSMKKRNVDGHITIVNSICGRIVPNLPGQSMNIYPASKHAVTAMVEVLRQELLAQGTKIRIASVSPGACRTGILGDDIEYPSYIPALNSEDVADAIVFGIQSPAHVQIHDLFIRPLGFDY
ncbi:uncharacterized protein LOC135956589 [Calliphora vicina]|uniref:uncharacterized protein LOC135956589 n=1 Tax=Calliphora vicina TaxID=7373 RepID=UPI00325A814E